MKTFSLCIVMVLIFFLTVSVSAQEPLVFENQQQQDRFHQLTQELRCLVCQNQTLADSDAPLAHALRREVYEMLQSGQSNDQIKLFLVERYGDFVLYRPPVQNNTYLLWLTPLILLLGGVLVLRASIKKRTALLTNNERPDENPDGNPDEWPEN
ncbi:MAG: cytochrome c-type biogenesis protein CcmH [Gammaproteobacteria bacterium]|nr:MAG: cytochrome c-type biogenesis protein CcmH [Gammaproteobacteria bacterium]